MREASPDPVPSRSYPSNARSSFLTPGEGEPAARKGLFVPRATSKWLPFSFPLSRSG